MRIAAPAIRVHHGEGAPVLLIRDHTNEGPGFSLQDGNGQVRGLFGLAGESFPWLTFVGAEDRPRPVKGTDADHRSLGRLLDKAGIPRAELTESGDDRGGLALRTTEDAPATGLVAGREPGGTLNVYGENG